MGDCDRCPWYLLEECHLQCREELEEKQRDEWMYEQWEKERYE